MTKYTDEQLEILEKANIIFENGMIVDMTAPDLVWSWLLLGFVSGYFVGYLFGYLLGYLVVGR